VTKSTTCYTYNHKRGPQNKLKMWRNPRRQEPLFRCTCLWSCACSSSILGSSLSCRATCPKYHRQGISECFSRVSTHKKRFTGPGRKKGSSRNNATGVVQARSPPATKHSRQEQASQRYLKNHTTSKKQGTLRSWLGSRS
jgi:hypothetical protein